MGKSQQGVIFLLFTFSICYSITMAADSPCGDWEPYKDEKCFKIIDETLRTYDDTIKTCQQQDNSSSLVSIHSLEEQDFFSNFLFKIHKVVDAVWIGAKYSSSKLKWADDSYVSFTNWAEGSPSNTADEACVQMIPEGSSMGKWADEPCNKKNLVVCQKMQTWSLSHLQQTLLNARKEFRDALNNIQQNPVPIGFIYAQLPNQPEPKTLWPMVEWTEVSSGYAGNFFRVVGGNAGSFGSTQDENAPRLVQVAHIEKVKYYPSPIKLNAGMWSNYTYTGQSVPCGEDKCVALEFEISGGEVRPRNQAMRIWKRTR